tara:strand:- start:227 stop:526 length:300 start_codon:yes stop_codon:yes gene_type:complete
MKEIISPHAKIVDTSAEKGDGMDFGSLAKTVLAGLGIHSAIDFIRKKSSDKTTVQDKRNKDELKQIEKDIKKNKKLQQKLNAKGMTLDDVLRQMKKNRK